MITYRTEKVLFTAYTYTVIILVDGLQKETKTGFRKERNAIAWAQKRIETLGRTGRDCPPPEAGCRTAVDAQAHNDGNRRIREDER